MTKIKLCGMFRDCDIDYMNEAEPDFCGFVFAESRRRVTFDKAEKMRARLSDKVRTVGVFVNAATDDIISLVRGNVISAVQLHGNEDENYIKALKSAVNCDIIRAVRVKTAEDILSAQTSAADYLLFDKFSADAYGGTGEMFDHSLVKSEKPFFLAGGLNIDNIKKAIRDTKPFAVDLSSGIETDGFKDRDKILDIVRRIRNV